MAYLQQRNCFPATPHKLNAACHLRASPAVRQQIPQVREGFLHRGGRFCV